MLFILKPHRFIAGRHRIRGVGIRGSFRTWIWKPSNNRSQLCTLGNRQVRSFCSFPQRPVFRGFFKYINKMLLLNDANLIGLYPCIKVGKNSVHICIPVGIGHFSRKPVKVIDTGFDTRLEFGSRIGRLTLCGQKFRFVKQCFGSGSRCVKTAKNLEL